VYFFKTEVNKMNIEAYQVALKYFFLKADYTVEC